MGMVLSKKAELVMLLDFYVVLLLARDASVIVVNYVNNERERDASTRWYYYCYGARI